METEAQRDLSDLPKAARLVGGCTWCRPRVSCYKAGILPPPTANAVGILAFLCVRCMALEEQGGRG